MSVPARTKRSNYAIQAIGWFVVYLLFYALFVWLGAPGWAAVGFALILTGKPLRNAS